MVTLTRLGESSASEKPVEKQHAADEDSAPLITNPKIEPEDDGFEVDQSIRTCVESFLNESTDSLDTSRDVKVPIQET